MHLGNKAMGVTSSPPHCTLSAPNSLLLPTCVASMLACLAAHAMRLTLIMAATGAETLDMSQVSLQMPTNHITCVEGTCIQNSKVLQAHVVLGGNECIAAPTATAVVRSCSTTPSLTRTTAAHAQQSCVFSRSICRPPTCA
jgi:hypothetical protein